MAQRIHIILTDDLDGTDAAETVSFALDGVNYEIDLNAENAAKLRDSLSTYIAHARKQRPARGGAARRSSKSSGETARIREWARSQGMAVSDRGRVSAEIRAAYEAANR